MPYDECWLLIWFKWILFSLGKNPSRPLLSLDFASPIIVSIPSGHMIDQIWSSCLTWPVINCVNISMWTYDSFSILIFQSESPHLFHSEDFIQNAQKKYHFIMLFDTKLLVNWGIYLWTTLFLSFLYHDLLKHSYFFPILWHWITWIKEILSITL